jgi:hypothetical protein
MMMRVVLSLLLVFLAAPARSQTTSTINAYLSQLLREHSTGMSERYAGTFSRLPEPLRTRAEKALPKHRFVIADMIYSHWGPDEVKILLVLDASSTRVVAYSWSPWYSTHSESFGSILTDYHPASVEEAMTIVRTVEEALADTATYEAGPVHRLDNQIEVALSRGDKPFRFVRVPFTVAHGFGRLELINPISGKADHTVVFPSKQR